MSYDVSATGLSVILRASKTFPAGVKIDAFADDADPFDIPNLETTTAGMGLNGDLVTFTTPVPIVVTVSVIPGSEDDVNLTTLHDNNRAARGRRHVGDVITLTAMYPDGSRVSGIQGKLTAGPVGQSAASGGRVKTRTFSFAFQDIQTSGRPATGVL